MENKTIIIIGAGPGGLTAGMILASRGFKVKIYEKADTVGGRNAALQLGDFIFDTGPTFLMMNFVLQQVFELAGRKVADYLDLKRLEPMYHLSFSDLDMSVYSDREKMKAEIARLFPGEEKGLDKFYKKENNRYKKLYPCLAKDYSKFTDFFSRPFIRAIPILGVGRSLYGNLSRYFKNELLRLSFTFQSKYLGMSPWDCPAGFTMIPFVEREFGIYHVIGGLNRISKAMAEVIHEFGGEIYLSTPVKDVITENKIAKGVELVSGEKIMADTVIVNADFAYAVTNIFKGDRLKKYAPSKIAKKKFSCSTFMLYLGLKKKYDLPHHNIFFAGNYRNNIGDIFERKTLSDDISFYLQNASVTDPLLATPGKSTMYILVPVPNNFSQIDWEKEKNIFRDLVLKTVMARTGLNDLLENIEEQQMTTPADWEKNYNVYRGATFNLAHNLGQMLYFRPHNKFEEIDSCYIVGGGTHPGSGLPTIYESGRISANLICDQFGVVYKKS